MKHADQTAGRCAIKIDGVSQTFETGGDAVLALDTLDFEIGGGEFVSIVGPSGCGKSTLLRIVSGLLAPTRGKVVIDGRPVNGPYTDLGIVFQNPILLDWRTLIENVMLQVELRRLPVADYIERARTLLEAVGLAGFEDRHPYELSGGMQQRASICRALIHDPPLLLMDEPFGALDALTREQIRIDIEELWLKTRKTVFFITHSITEAVLLSDRVVVMTPRPGNIERIIPIPLPRPRGLEAIASREYTSLVEEITDIFLSRGVLQGARSALAKA